MTSLLSPFVVSFGCRSSDVSLVSDGAADGVRERFAFLSFGRRLRFATFFVDVVATVDLSSSDLSGFASMNSRIRSRSSSPRYPSISSAFTVSFGTAFKWK